jgi:hypothetical protein
MTTDAEILKLIIQACAEERARVNAEWQARMERGHTWICPVCDAVTDEGNMETVRDTGSDEVQDMFGACANELRNTRQREEGK